MGNENSIDYRTSYHTIDPQGFISLYNLIISQTFISICRGKISNIWCLHYWKTHMRVKQLNLDNSTHAATRPNLAQVLITPLKQRKITPSIRQGFFENLFPKQKGRGEKFLMPMYLRIFLINILKSTLIYLKSTSENEPAIEIIQNKSFPFLFFFCSLLFAADYLLQILAWIYFSSLKSLNFIEFSHG